MKRNNLIEIALGEFGIREIPGRKDNPRIINYFDRIGFDGARLKDETSWCSAFVNWAAREANCVNSGRLNARSWLKTGKATELPMIGDVVVLWRESAESWKGHVGFFIRETKSWVYLLGGNQGNRVSIQAYPKSRVLGYRDIT